MATKKVAAPKKEVEPRFAAWIMKRGVAQTAKDLGVTRFTIYDWVAGARNVANGRAFNHAVGGRKGGRPSPEKMGAIIALAEGFLSAADIYPSAK